jgi:hypothetical protein
MSPTATALRPPPPPHPIPPFPPPPSPHSPHPPSVGRFGRSDGRGRRFAPPFGRGFGAGLNGLIPMFTGRLKSWLDAVTSSKVIAGCNLFGRGSLFPEREIATQDVLCFALRCCVFSVMPFFAVLRFAVLYCPLLFALLCLALLCLALLRSVLLWFVHGCPFGGAAKCSHQVGTPCRMGPGNLSEPKNAPTYPGRSGKTILSHFWR